jgi:hypothetical protein
MQDINYERDIRIDESALDVEWLEQPRLMVKYAQHATACTKVAELAEQHLDVLKADLDKDIRQNPGMYSIKNPTVEAIKNAIIANETIQEANKAWIEAKFEANMAWNAVKAFEHRKSALENLVKLHGQQYFASPTVPRDLSAEWTKRSSQQKADAAIVIGRRRTL